LGGRGLGFEAARETCYQYKSQYWNFHTGRVVINLDWTASNSVSSIVFWSCQRGFVISTIKNCIFRSYLRYNSGHPLNYLEFILFRLNKNLFKPEAKIFQALFSVFFQIMFQAFLLAIL
jgi:hypothetical protein